jgi:hypothetical protein
VSITQTVTYEHGDMRSDGQSTNQSQRGVYFDNRQNRAHLGINTANDSFLSWRHPMIEHQGSEQTYIFGVPAANLNTPSGFTSSQYRTGFIEEPSEVDLKFDPESRDSNILLSLRLR